MAQIVEKHRHLRLATGSILASDEMIYLAAMSYLLASRTGRDAILNPPL